MATSLQGFRGAHGALQPRRRAVTVLPVRLRQVAQHGRHVRQADAPAPGHRTDWIVDTLLHGGVDIVFSNHYTRVQPDDDPRAVIDYYVEANNLGTTHVLRSFAPLLRDGGRLFVVASRAGSLRALAPALHPRFENLQSLDDVDRAVCSWRDAVRSGRAPGQA